MSTLFRSCGGGFAFFFFFSLTHPLDERRRRPLQLSSLLSLHLCPTKFRHFYFRPLLRIKCPSSSFSSSPKCTSVMFFKQQLMTLWVMRHQAEQEHTGPGFDQELDKAIRLQNSLGQVKSVAVKWGAPGRQDGKRRLSWVTRVTFQFLSGLLL